MIAIYNLFRRLPRRPYNVCGSFAQHRNTICQCAQLPLTQRIHCARCIGTARRRRPRHLSWTNLHRLLQLRRLVLFHKKRLAVRDLAFACQTLAEPVQFSHTCNRNVSSDVSCQAARREHRMPLAGRNSTHLGPSAANRQHHRNYLLWSRWVNRRKTVCVESWLGGVACC